MTIDRKNKKRYKKGDVLEITFKTSEKGKTIKTRGIIFKIHGKEITLGHNFSGLEPIDITLIDTDFITSSRKITPKEINFIQDL